MVGRGRGLGEEVGYGREGPGVGGGGWGGGGQTNTTPDESKILKQLLPGHWIPADAEQRDGTAASGDCCRLVGRPASGIVHHQLTARCTREPIRCHT